MGSRAMRRALATAFVALAAMICLVSGALPSAAGEQGPGVQAARQPACLPSAWAAATSATTATPLGRLSVVPCPGGGRFINPATGALVIPRGSNYVRSIRRVLPDGTVLMSHSTFDTGVPPDNFSVAQASRALDQLQAQHYNTVRVFLNSLELGNPTGAGLNQTYVGNVIEFLWLAKSHGIKVILVLASIPAKGGYAPTTPSSIADAANRFYLDPAFVAAEQRYVQDFITLLIAQRAPLDDILTFELTGEQWYVVNRAPLNRTTGFITTADGRTYDLSRADQVTLMEDSNLRNWANRLSGTIHSLIPGSLTSVGIFPPMAAKPADHRIVRPQTLFSKGTNVDVIDLHLYRTFGWPIPQIRSLGVPTPSITKPVIIGEFGTFRFQFPNASLAAIDDQKWQARSCNIIGLSPTGWLSWTWDTPTSQEPRIYSMKAGGWLGALALSPALHRDPCH